MKKTNKNLTQKMKYSKLASAMFLAFSANFAHADLNPMNNKDLLGFDCSAGNNMCIGNMSPQDTIYWTNKYKCIYDANGKCIDYTGDGLIFGKDKYAVRDAFVSNQIDISQQINPKNYVIGSQDCFDDTNGTFKCSLTMKREVSDGQGGTTWITEKGGTFGILVFRTPSTTGNVCGTSGTYINGLGCIGNGGNYPVSDRTVTALDSSCKTGQCESPDLGNLNNKPVSGGIDVVTGSKIEEKTDMVYPFRFTRNYVSKRNTRESLGANWKHNFEKHLLTKTSYTQDETAYVGSVIITQENDEQIVFSRLSPNDNFDKVFIDQNEFNLEVSGNNYILKAPNGSKEVYSNDGKLNQIVQPGGYSLSLEYTGGNLNKVTDSYGRFMNFSYSNGLLSNITTDHGDFVDYSYSGDLLQSQSLNGGRTISYGYQGNNLTTISNAAGENVINVTYDTNGNATQSKINTGNGFVNITDVSYTSNNSIANQTNTSESFDKTTANFKDVLTQSILSTNSDPSFTNLNKTINLNNSLPESYTDVDGNIYNYTYDNDGWLASSSKNGIVTTFDWNKTKNLLLSSTKTTNDGTITTNYTYNNDNLLLEKSIVTSSSGTRTWSYTYGTFGKILTQTEPNGAVTTYSYYSDTDSNISKRGKLSSISNALAHTISINSYDNRGNPTSITMPNGIVKTHTYNDIGQVLTETINGSITTNYTYNVNGSLTQVQLPSGYVVNFVYDQAGRQIGLSDNQGGSITYVLDSVTNLPTNTSVYKNSILQTTANQVIDGLGRLKETWKANSTEKYSYSYSSQGYATGFKVGSEINPRNEYQNSSYDKSLMIYQNGFGKTTGITYDQNDNPTTVQANDIPYNLTYNQFDEVLTSENSNSGTDSYVYDVVNKKVTKTDSSNISTVTQYDSIGRIVSINAGGEEKSFIYDNVQIGKLSSATIGNTTISYTYNNLGLVTSKTQVVGTDSKIISYGYDSIGQLTSITYPSGLTLTYARTNGFITGISYGSGNIISNINSQAMTSNPLSWNWGNGLTRTKTYDTSGKITSLTDGLLNQSYNLDGLFNILSIVDSGTTKNYEYQNPSSPVTKYSTSLGELRYGFNTQNARTFSVDNFNSVTSNFNYTYGTNKLSQWDDGSNYFTYSYDSKGNVTNNGKGSFSYNNQNNLASATISENTFSYGYNGFDERVAKSGTNVNRTYLYNENHQLIGEYENGNLVAEYIYFGETPIAVYQNNQMYFVHTDHLNTPRAITNSSQTLVWKWDNTEPFGKNLPVNSGIDFNLRYSGQIFDNETGLFYNYFRYYNPETGRYMQVDPIGIYLTI